MKSVLITGATGSFGNAFVLRLLDMSDAERIVVYSRDENKQYHMEQLLHSHPRYSVLRLFIGDVRDADRLLFAMHDVSTVIHAAALKIVPTAEYNPTECIATNVTGAENVVKTAIRAGVSRVVALSTDKAVNPINLYGASKLAAEKIFIAANSLAAGATRFSVVRYGNVVGSRGSVVPLFKKLALEGKPLPITDKRMTRFWITMDQAINLVLYAHKGMRGREIFIPKIPSIRILDLAAAFGNLPLEYIGIRPGEKLHECLVTEDESSNAIVMGKEVGNCFIINPNLIDEEGTYIPIGDILPEGFRYDSNTNTEWLTVEQLKESLNG